VSFMGLRKICAWSVVRLPWFGLIHIPSRSLRQWRNHRMAQWLNRAKQSAVDGRASLIPEIALNWCNYPPYIKTRGTNPTSLLLSTKLSRNEPKCAGRGSRFEARNAPRSFPQPKATNSWSWKANFPFPVSSFHFLRWAKTRFKATKSLKTNGNRLVSKPTQWCWLSARAKTGSKSVSFWLKLGFVVVFSACSLANTGCRKRLDPPPKPFTAFVASRKSGTVTAVDLANFRVAATIPVAPQPDQVAVRPEGPASSPKGRIREIYVVSASGRVSAINFSSLKVTGVLNLGRSAQDLAFQPAGHRAYVLAPDAGDVIALDCDSFRVAARLHLSTGLSGLALATDGKTLVAANGANQKLYVIGADAMKLLDELEINAIPGQMGIVPGGSKVYVVDAGEREITAVDLPKRVLLANLDTNSVPSTLVFKPDGGEIFVLSAQGSNLTVVDAFHDDVEQSPLTTGPNPVAAVLRADASVLYIATAGDGNIMALDAPDRQPLAYVHVGIRPSALALTPDERYLLVGDPGSSSIAVVRTDRNTLVTTIPVGEEPMSVVVPEWQRK